MHPATGRMPGVFCLLILVACTSNKSSSTTRLSIPTIIPSSTPPATPMVVPSLTPSAIPTHSLESLKDKLPSTTPASGFIVLEIPETAPVDGMITVTIYTASGAECSIWYYGTNGGPSHATGLEPQIADANGMCSWTWKQAMGAKNSSISMRASVIINANGEQGTYYIVVQ